MGRPGRPEAALRAGAAGGEVPFPSLSLDLIARAADEEYRPALLVAAPFQSLGAAIQNMHLAARALGYGSCSATGPLFMARELEELLGVKAPWRLIAFVPIGVPAEDPRTPRRRPLEEVCTTIE